jgi:hypothetical protein
MTAAPMPSLAETIAELPLELARPWPDGLPQNAQRPNDRDECDSCRWPMQGDKLWWNGAYFHARCAAEHERLILGEDACPGLLEHLDALEERCVFLLRLAAAADQHGIDRATLARAVAEACR